MEVYAAAVVTFQNRHPTLHVEQIEKKHIRNYIEWMQGEKKSPKTIHKEHGVIRALLNVAKRQEWIEQNPASEIQLPAKNRESPIRSYTVEEVNRVFASPVFVNVVRPRPGKGDAAYWVPLLLLFTGARREEICQLTIYSVKETAGVTFLSINPCDDEGRVKNDQSRRVVPIHSQLLDLGFLRFVAGRRKEGAKMLFDQLRANKRGQLGAKWGDWWAKYVRQTVGITDTTINPAHSFRHLFITECRAAHIREDSERALVGHVGDGGRKDAHDNYGEHRNAALAEAINQITFKGLDLSRLPR